MDGGGDISVPETTHLAKKDTEGAELFRLYV